MDSFKLNIKLFELGETRTFDGVTLCLPKMLALPRTVLEATDQNSKVFIPTRRTMYSLVGAKAQEK